ncbi:hypothetical protein M8J76_001741 [Diaphorina citri]|nr:hypothetical protein M8J76_001741 [Diaphorina citri]
MGKGQYRAVISFLILDGKKCDEIKSKGPPWWPKNVRTVELVEKVHDLVVLDRRTKVCVVAESVDILYGTVFMILHEMLGMKNLSAQWLPRLSPWVPRLTASDLFKGLPRPMETQSK